MSWTGFTGTFACIFYTEEDDKESTQWPQFYIRDFMKEFLRFGLWDLFLGVEH